MPAKIKLYVNTDSDQLDRIRDLISSGAAALTCDADQLRLSRHGKTWGLDLMSGPDSEALGELSCEGSEYMSAVSEHASRFSHKVVDIQLVTNKLGCETVVITVRQQANFKFFKVTGVNSGGKRMATARQHQCANIKRTLGKSKGVLLHLVREPDNPYDECAIKVIYDYTTVKGVRKCFHLGYVNRATAQWLSKIMDHKVFVAVNGTEITGGESGYLYGAKIRLGI